MNKTLAAACIGNSFSFSVHWIYDPKYIQDLIQREDVFFKAPQKHHYDEAKSAYFGYPHGKAGDITVQGMFLVWLTQALSRNPNLNVKDYQNLLLSHIAPGGDYVGYVESYAKKLIVNDTAISMGKEPVFEMDDEHLVGFVPYLATKALSLPVDKAKELVELFSNKSEYAQLFDVFDALLNGITPENKAQKLRDVIDLAPISYQAKLIAALSDKEDRAFLKEDAGIACIIPQSIPVIFRLLDRANTYEEAMRLNVTYGGAISERAMMLGYCFAQFSDIPPEWFNQLTPEIQSIIQAL